MSSELVELLEIVEGTGLMGDELYQRAASLLRTLSDTEYNIWKEAVELRKTRFTI